MTKLNSVKLKIQGRRLVVKDAAIMLYQKAKKPEWPCVDVTPGDYVVSLQKAGKNVIGIRVAPAAETKTKRGKALGFVAVDHGAVALCDYDVLFPLTKSHPTEYADWTENECEEAIWETAFGGIAFKGCRMVHAKTGVGDGKFPVFALVAENRVVGLECDFIAEPKNDPPPRSSHYTWVELKLHGIGDPWSFCDDRDCGAPDLELILFDLECEVENASNEDLFGNPPAAAMDRSIAAQVKRFRGIKKVEVFNETNQRRVNISDQMKALLSAVPKSPEATPRQLARSIYKIFKAAAKSLA